MSDESNNASNKSVINTNTALSKVGRFFSSNYTLLIISLLCAMVLWGFVLANQNPERTKTISGIRLSFEGEADLIARNLTVVGDRDSILPEVTVQVTTDLLHYSDLGAGSITATVSLRGVTDDGTETLSIRATTSNGTVVSISPASITLEIDKLTTKRLPIVTEYVSDVSTGYWRAEPDLDQDTVDISGPYSILESISEAICPLDLSKYTSDVAMAVNLTLRDTHGFYISSDLLNAKIPTVTVSVRIYPVKTVALDLEGALFGKDALPENYEVFELLTDPKTVRIIGSALTLENITALSLEKTDISGETASQTRALKIILPDGVTVLDGISTVTAHIGIREKRMSQTFTNMQVSVVNLQRGHVSRLVYAYTDVTVTGPVSVINAIQRNQISVFADVSGLSAGVYDLPVQITFKNGEITKTVSYTLSNTTCSVIISAG